MRYIIAVMIIISFGECSVVKAPVKAGKTAVKTPATGVKTVGKGVKTIVD